MSTLLGNEIHVFLVGPGGVGKELLHQIQETKPEIRVVGLGNSRFMHFDPNGIDLDSWETLIADEPMSLDGFIERMVSLHLDNSVFVDCTSSEAVAATYATILQSHISVVTPNKKANSGPFSTYLELQNLSEDVKFLYDANVGAGLPIIHTIQTLRRAGDQVIKIEAILSGTLSYLFNTYDGSLPFSTIVRHAQRKGYTEPDPSEDLNGMDMARKFLILAREAGYALERSDIDILPFLPESCFDAPTVEEFYQRLADYDEQLSYLVKDAADKGAKYRFIGTLEDGRATLSLKAIGPDHPFYHISGTDNIAAITSRNYPKSPVVIKGPGAGATVTAAAVLANIVQN
jgi:aspartokinase/homoserine dehydrogenase 1